MKLVVIAHYEESDLDVGSVERTSEDLKGWNVNTLSRRLDIAVYEDENEVTVDHGGTDEEYELELAESFETKAEAETNAQKLFDYALEMLKE